MLLDRRQKRKWNVTSWYWKAKFGTLHTEKNYLLVTFSFVRGSEGDRATSPSSASRNGSIDASRLSLEAQMERDFMKLEGEFRHFAHKKNYLLALFTFVHGVEDDEATSPSFARLKTLGLMLSARRWKRFLQLYKCKRQHFTHGKQNTYLPIFKFLQAERATRQRRSLL